MLRAGIEGDGGAAIRRAGIRARYRDGRVPFFGTRGDVDGVQALIETGARAVHRLRDDVERAARGIDNGRTGDADFWCEVSKAGTDEVAGAAVRNRGLVGAGPVSGVDETDRPELVARDRVRIERVERVVRRGNEDDVASDAANAHVRHPERLRVDRAIDDAAGELAERGRSYCGWRKRVLPRVGAVSRERVVVREHAGEICDADRDGGAVTRVRDARGGYCVAVAGHRGSKRYRFAVGARGFAERAAGGGDRPSQAGVVVG